MKFYNIVLYLTDFLCVMTFVILDFSNLFYVKKCNCLDNSVNLTIWEFDTQST